MIQTSVIFVPRGITNRRPVITPVMSVPLTTPPMKIEQTVMYVSICSAGEEQIPQQDVAEKQIRWLFGDRSC